MNRSSCSNGARPVFIDAESKYWQMDPNLVEDFLTRRCVWSNHELRNRETNRRVRAIMPVHVLGHAVDMDPILDLARRFNLSVVEDAAEGIGASYKNRALGGLGNVGCISFNGNKLITTGGGGVLLTNDPQIAKTARHLTTQAKTDAIEYIHDQVGYNYRLTNIAAAVGCAQLEQLDRFITSKREIANDYATRINRVPGVRFFQASRDVFCTYWMNTIQVDAAEFGMGSRDVLRQLHVRGIQTRPLWQPMHLSPAHQGCQSLLTGVAERAYAECLNVPSSVDLTSNDVARVCDALCELGQQAPAGKVAA